ncbi:Apolipoprotein N-acyltransferase / Copper homeostasis protein CutE [hydrothermal vent metagenome]|uniref:Apolipoprotein N-acyltransferase / Copper homeostasis protein CutE n=1 Tax=hydrothermal vent metagenome TaxID=652676 RepID=A0A3B1C5M2_9ZZZZ
MVLPLAFAPVSFFPLAVISPAILFYLYLNLSSRRAALAGFVFGLGFFGVGVSWVYVAFHEFGHSPVSVSALMTAIFVAVLALFPALQSFLSVYIWQKVRPRLATEKCALLLLFPALWGLSEWLRGWLFTGFPWLNLGYSQTDSPLAGYAPVLGVYGLSLLLVICAGLILLLLRNRSQWQGLLGFLLLIWLGGFLLTKYDWTQPIGKPVKVSLVQGNVPQITKWDPKMIQARLDTYANLSREHWDSDLIVWPENAMTTFYNDLVDSYFAPLRKEARAHNTDLIIGAPVMDKDGVRYYSSLISLSDKTIIYNKRHLVPFGEFIPLQNLLRGLIGFFDLPMSGFSPGDKHQQALHAAGQLLAPSICYEDAFGEELIDFLPQATLLVNGSNNAWYGDSFAPPQHLQISRMGSIETGRALLRATTNGISAIVDSKGRIIKRSPQFKTVVITAQVQPRTGATPYVRFGNTPVLIILTLMLFAVGLARKPFC